MSSKPSTNSDVKVSTTLGPKPVYCHRCHQIIYDHIKLGPVNGNTYHKSCFKCRACDTLLTLKSFATSQADIIDREVYCIAHAPRATGLPTLPPSRWGNRDGRNIEYISPDVPKKEFGVDYTNVLVDTHTGKTINEARKWSSRENLASQKSYEGYTDNQSNSSSSSSSKLLVDATMNNTLNETQKSYEGQIGSNNSANVLIDTRTLADGRKWSSREDLLTTQKSYEGQIGGSSSSKILVDTDMNRTLTEGKKWSSKENLITTTQKSYEGQIGSNNSTRVLIDNGVSKTLAEAKKWSSRENLLAMQTNSEGRVASLSKKWNSKENLVSPSSSTVSNTLTNSVISSTSPTISITTSAASNSTSSSARIISRDSISSSRKNSEASTLDNRNYTGEIHYSNSRDSANRSRINSDASNLDNRNYSGEVNYNHTNSRDSANRSRINSDASNLDNRNYSGEVNLTIQRDSSNHSRKNSEASTLDNRNYSGETHYTVSRDSNNRSRKNSEASTLDNRNYTGEIHYSNSRDSNNRSRKNSDALTLDNKQYSGEVKSTTTIKHRSTEYLDTLGTGPVRAEYSYTSQSTEVKKSPQTIRKVGSTENLLQNSGNKFIGDDLGGINYKKFIGEVKNSERRQQGFSDLATKRANKNPLLYPPSVSKKSGSTGDLTETIHIQTGIHGGSVADRKPKEHKANVQKLFKDELNFYETFKDSNGQINAEYSYQSHQSHQARTASNRVLKNLKHSDERSASASNSHRGSMDYLAHIPDEKIRIRLEHQPANSYTNLSLKDEYGNSKNVQRQFSNNSVDTKAAHFTTSNFTKYEKQTRSSRDNLLNNGGNKDTLYYITVTGGAPLPVAKRELGKIMISYRYYCGELAITIHRAENLNFEKQGSLDTYVRMMLLPDPERSTLCSTGVDQNSMNPVWEQTFIYRISPQCIRSKYIYLSVKDHKMATELLSTGLQDEALKLISLGETLLPLNEIQENVLYDVFLTLQEPSEIQEIILGKDI